jgi:holo-[acyl-carrier protein] synthase
VAIHGIGSDLIRVARLAAAIDRHGDRFARRILDEGEYAEYEACGDRAAFLAKRFAAKEAAAKALGLGTTVSADRFSVSMDALRSWPRHMESLPAT